MPDEAPEEGAAAGGGGSVLKKYGPLALIVLIAQVVLAWGVVTFLLKDKVAEEPKEEELLAPPSIEMTERGEKQEREGLPYYYSSEELKSITTNPAGTNAERFVMFSVQLGLVARDHKESPPKDITDQLGGNTAVLDKISQYDPLIKATIVSIVRQKTIEQLVGENISDVQDEIRRELNRKVFQKLFAWNKEKENKIEVVVEEVVFSDLIIQ